MNFTILDGWNLFSYCGLESDGNEKRTVACKSLDNCEVKIKSWFDKGIILFELTSDTNDETTIFNRLSNAMYVGDTILEKNLKGEKF